MSHVWINLRWSVWPWQMMTDHLFVNSRNVIHHQSTVWLLVATLCVLIVLYIYVWGSLCDHRQALCITRWGEIRAQWVNLQACHLPGLWELKLKPRPWPPTYRSYLTGNLFRSENIVWTLCESYVNSALKGIKINDMPLYTLSGLCKFPIWKDWLYMQGICLLPEVTDLKSWCLWMLMVFILRVCGNLYESKIRAPSSHRVHAKYCTFYKYHLDCKVDLISVWEWTEKGSFMCVNPLACNMF